MLLPARFSWLRLLSLSLSLAFLSSISSQPCVPDGNNLIVTMAMGFGLQNQITLIAKSLLMGVLTQRHVCVGLFLPYHAGWPSIPMEMVVNMTETNRALSRIPGVNTSVTYLTPWTEGGASHCACYLFQGTDGVNLPAGHRRCVGKPW
ncbi:hypothetical protein EON64_18980, partial [archaeon]